MHQDAVAEAWDPNGASAFALSPAARSRAGNDDPVTMMMQAADGGVVGGDPYFRLCVIVHVVHNQTITLLQ